MGFPSYEWSIRIMEEISETLKPWGSDGSGRAYGLQ